MKCLYLTTEFLPGPGGIGVHSHQIIEQLKKQYDWDFKVILTQLDNSSLYDFDKFKKGYHADILLLKKSPSIIKLFINLVSLLITAVKYNPSIIISSGRHATWFGAFIKLFLRKKLVTFAHGSEFGTKDPKEKKINKYSYSYSNLIISVSKYTLNYIKTKTNINCKNITVINNGANQKTFFKLNFAEKEKFIVRNKLKEKKIIITLGNISKRKGQWVVINAMPEILKKNPNAYYYCIGNPTEKDDFLKLAKKLNVQNRVVFLVAISNTEVVKWLNISKIFLMTSTHTKDGDFEGFGIAVIEAALCGIPAIVTKGNNGVIESIVEGKTGFGVKEKSHLEVAEKVNFFLENSVICKKMGENARKRAIEKYTWEIKTREIYKAIQSIYF